MEYKWTKTSRKNPNPGTLFFPDLEVKSVNNECSITPRRSTVHESGSGLRAYTAARSAVSLGVRANMRMGTCPLVAW